MGMNEIWTDVRVYIYIYIYIYMCIYVYMLIVKSRTILGSTFLIMIFGNFQVRTATSRVHGQDAAHAGVPRGRSPPSPGLRYPKGPSAPL